MPMKHEASPVEEGPYWVHDMNYNQGKWVIGHYIDFGSSQEWRVNDSDDVDVVEWKPLVQPQEAPTEVEYNPDLGEYRPKTP